jgi:predicted Mrr-cat superfamily restriction endonuclease
MFLLKIMDLNLIKNCHENLYGFVNEIVKKGEKVIVFNEDTRFVRDLGN